MDKTILDAFIADLKNADSSTQEKIVTSINAKLVKDNAKITRLPIINSEVQKIDIEIAELEKLPDQVSVLNDEKFERLGRLMNKKDKLMKQLEVD